MLFSGLGLPNLFSPERLVYGIAAAIRLFIYLAIYVPYLIQRIRFKKVQKRKEDDKRTGSPEAKAIPKPTGAWSR